MLYIRVDANEQIATGHLMRCLSIADAARGLGEDTTFILADDGAVEMAMRRGYRTIVLHTPWDDMDRETDAILQVIREHHIARLLVDSYQVTKTYLSVLSMETEVAYIDDLGKVVCPVGTLVCYAPYYGKFDYPMRYPNAKLLLGTAYAPLRKEFCGLPKKAIHEDIERILVLSGGTNQANSLQQVLDALRETAGVHVDAFCGAFCEEIDELREQYRPYGNISLHRSTDDIVSYMKDADIAISAGGTTLYELCACGTPTITYAFADNQLDNVGWFAENQIMSYAGDARTGKIGNKIQGALLEYGDKAYRARRSVRMQSMVDGCGAERIARELMVSGV